MSTFFTSSSHMPCSACGASVARGEQAKHRCDPERLLDFKMFQVREEIAAFDELLSDYLESRNGRFAQWLALRTRPLAPGEATG
jgi:hypothetical protein